MFVFGGEGDGQAKQVFSIYVQSNSLQAGRSKLMKLNGQNWFKNLNSRRLLNPKLNEEKTERYIKRSN